jgi:hypothetical protein
MTVIGTVAQWEDFFAEELVPSVVTLVLDAWKRIVVPTAGELEKIVSLRLYSALVTSKDRNKHPFLIRYEDVEIDARAARETGRKDIVFFPSLNDEDIYFCLEAKRLNVTVGGRRRALADEYVKSGMQRFVEGQYSRQVRHAGMIGYVLDGRTTSAMSSVLRNIQAQCLALGMESPGTWTACDFLPTHPYLRVTRHTRQDSRTPLRIHHIFVSSDQTPARIATLGGARARRRAR